MLSVKECWASKPSPLRLKEAQTVYFGRDSGLTLVELGAVLPGKGLHKTEGHRAIAKLPVGKAAFQRLRASRMDSP